MCLLGPVAVAVPVRVHVIDTKSFELFLNSHQTNHFLWLNLNGVKMRRLHGIGAEAAAAGCGGAM